MKKGFEQVFKNSLNNILLQWDKKMDRDVASKLPDNISINDAKIMYHIYNSDEPINASVLMKLLNVTKGTLSVNIEKLSQKGYLLKESDTSDARVSYLVLTESGIKIAKLYDENINAIVKRIDSDFNTYEKSLLLISLSKVEDILYE